MDDTLIFIDEAFLAKLSKYLGKGKYIKFDKYNFVNNLCTKQNLDCKKIFYYTCPPFQSEPPIKEEELRKEDFDKSPLKNNSEEEK